MSARRHNSQTLRDRQRLLANFEGRLRHDEELGDTRHWLRHAESIAWVVHPLADEAELLAELGVLSEDCQAADAYWRYGESVYFVQLHGRKETSRPPGAYYCFDTQHRQDDFDVFLETPTVTSTDFRRTFDLLSPLIDSGAINDKRARLRSSGGRWSSREVPLASAPKGKG